MRFVFDRCMVASLVNSQDPTISQSMRHLGGQAITSIESTLIRGSASIIGGGNEFREKLTLTDDFANIGRCTACWTCIALTSTRSDQQGLQKG